MRTVPVARGISKLSFNKGVENSSIRVAVKTVKIFTINNVGESENTIKVVVIINAIDPSNDLLKSFVLPYPIPIIAAAESDKLIVKSEIIATFSLNNTIVSAEPINTQEAPDNLLFSCGRVTMPNIL